MERLSLQATIRGTGKNIAKKLRASGTIPAILYGRGKEPLPLAVADRAFGAFAKASPDLTALIDLKVEGGESTFAVIRDYQADVVKRNITHVDFQAVDINEKIDIEVPINLLGIPLGVKDDGGVLEQLRRKIHIRALATKIPSHIEVDVSNLKIGDSIHADEIALPEGVEFPHATNYTIATVVPPAKEEVPVVAAAPVEGEAAAAAPAEGEAAPAEGKEKEKEKE